MLIILNKILKQGFIFLIATLIITSCFKEELIVIKGVEITQLDFDRDSINYIMINNLYCGIDLERKMVLVPLPISSIDNYKVNIQSNFKSIHIGSDTIYSKDSYTFSSISVADSIPITIMTCENKKFNVFLQFTSLPVLQIYTSDTIIDDTLTPCRIALNYFIDKTWSDQVVTNAGIKLRGRYALAKPKKSFSFELWVDSTGNLRRYQSLLGMRYEDDWILDAMYMDKSRMRNKVSWEIWRDLISYHPTYNTEGKRYTESEFIEVFKDQQYLGLYRLAEKIDAKQIGTKINKLSDALLYKADTWTESTDFDELPDTLNVGNYWNGWEQIFPEYNGNIWCFPIYNFVDFVINSSDEEFNNHVYEHLHAENLVDYLIFINLIEANDNMGANMFYYKKNYNAPFEIIPWDLDASWGRIYNSSMIGLHYCIRNKFYIKLMSLNTDDFNQRVANRWNDLRRGPAQLDLLTNRFIFLADILKNSGAIYREEKRWPEIELDLDFEMDFITSRTKERLDFLDDYFNNTNLED